MTFQWPLALLALLLVPAAAIAYVLLDGRRRASDAAQFASPAIFPNVVGRSPGRVRHVPAAILLLAVAALVTGFARPHADRTVKLNEATVVLAVDTSRSMTATDVKPSRLAAAGDAIERFLKIVPPSLRVGVVTFADRAAVVAPPSHDRQVVQDALHEVQPGEGTALGDALTLALRSARSVRDDSNKPPPASILVISDGAQTQGTVTPQAAARKAKAAGVPIYSVVIGTPSGVVTRKLTGGYTERVRVPPDPDALKLVATDTGGQAFVAADDANLKRVYDELGKRLGHERKPAEVTAAFAGAGMLLLLASGALSAALFPEDSVKRALLVLAVALVPLAFAGEARATNECRGLDTCISVPGPWVAVPAAPATTMTTTYFQMRCPKGSIAGGLDAILGDKTLDVTFLGKLGSPVNPGITTSRSVVFVATYPRGVPTAFRPVLGCIPTSGGGGRSTTAYHPVVVKPQPVLRRVHSIPLRGVSRQVTARCGGGERLVGWSSATGLRTKRQPAAGVLNGVRVATRRRGNTVVVRATRTTAVPRSVRVIVQVHLLCARGPR